MESSLIIPSNLSYPSLLSLAESLNIAIAIDDTVVTIIAKIETKLSELNYLMKLQEFWHLIERTKREEKIRNDKKLSDTKIEETNRSVRRRRR